MNPTQAEVMEALDHAFEAYEEYGNQEALDELREAIEGVRAYLQASGEPVAWMEVACDLKIRTTHKQSTAEMWGNIYGSKITPLYTHPQPAPMSDGVTINREMPKCGKAGEASLPAMGLDYFYDPADWEWTQNADDDSCIADWLSESMTDVMEVQTLINGPLLYAVNLPKEWDDEGNPTDSEVTYFDSEEDAKTALADCLRQAIGGDREAK